MENELSLYLDSPTCVQNFLLFERIFFCLSSLKDGFILNTFFLLACPPAAQWWHHSTFPSSEYLHSLHRHSSKFSYSTRWVHNHNVSSQLIIGGSMRLRSMVPCLTLLNSEWWSMPSTGFSDLNLWTLLTLKCDHDLVHFTRLQHPYVHQSHIMQVLYSFFKL